MVEWKQSRVDGEISVIELMEVSMIELKQINHDNWIECIELEVKDEQRQFVNPNIFSLAEAYVHSDASKKEAEEYYSESLVSPHEEHGTMSSCVFTRC